MPYPPFRPTPPKIPRDALTHEGALRLAARIRAHWAGLGFDVKTRIEPCADNEEGRGSTPIHYAIRSDLMGGLPQRRLSSRGA